MTRTLLTIITLTALWGNQSLEAFSLAGPRPPWMSEPAPSSSACYSGTTGPMNINEEYRINVPVLFYGVTADFANHFGLRGIQEMRKAVALISDVPSAEQIDIDSYPTQSFRVNHRARALGLVDIKSVALQALLHTIGLEDPIEYVYAPRDAWIVNNFVVEYFMTVRNFDPVTLRQSPYINNTLYTYTRQGCPLVFPVDPVERLFPRTTPSAALRRGNIALHEASAGTYLTGLTRDDVGAIKYIYNPKNYNMETVPPGISGSGGGGGVAVGGGGGPFDFPGFGGGAGGGAYDSAVIITNTIAGGGLGQGQGQGVATNAFINPAVRGGIGDVSFVEANYDSLMGEFFVSRTVQFRDTVVTNGTTRSQQLIRTVTEPDIIFDAKDLQGAFASTPLPPAYVVYEKLDVNWTNSDPFDGTTGNEDGPGIIGGTRFTFNTVTPWIPGFPDATGSFLDDGSFGAFSVHMWGAFDGTTDDPVIFPIGTEFEELESLIFSR